MENIFDAEGNKLHEGDRVYTFDCWINNLVYGTLVKNEFKEVSDWAVNYDDGECCALLSFNEIWKS